MEELSELSRITAFVPPPGYPQVSEVIGDLAQKYVAHKDVRSISKEIGVAIRHCLRAQAFPAVDAICNQILTAELNQGYQKNTLLPLIPILRLLADQFDALDALAPTFQQIFLALISKLPEMKSSNAGARFLAEMSLWDCLCEDCKQIRLRLTSGRSQKIQFRGISPDRVLHIEVLLRKHVSADAFTVFNASGNLKVRYGLASRFVFVL